MNVGWNCNEERLLCLVVLSDEMAPLLSEKAGEAFFRGFVVKDRISSAIQMRMRWRYRDGDSWATLTPKNQEPAAALAELKFMISEVLTLAARMMGRFLPLRHVRFFEPPDDGGNFESTLEWLLEKDLVHMPTMEKASTRTSADGTSPVPPSSRALSLDCPNPKKTEIPS